MVTCSSTVLYLCDVHIPSAFSSVARVTFLTMLWENGETSDEPLSVIAADDPVSCAMYAHDHDLLDLAGWRRFRTLAKRQKNFFRLANLAKIRKFSTRAKYKYGYEIPRDFRHGVEIDERNGNTKWQDATKLELASIKIN